MLKRSNKNIEKGKTKISIFNSRNVLTLFTISDASSRSLQSSITGTTQTEKQRLSPTIETGNGSTGKKPIHSRLGPIASQALKTKKPWRSEKVFFIKV